MSDLIKQLQTLTSMADRCEDGVPYRCECNEQGQCDACHATKCLACGERDCPHQDPLHYHYDGCPFCVFDEEKKA